MPSLSAITSSVLISPEAQLRTIQAPSRAPRKPRAQPEPVGQKGCKETPTLLQHHRQQNAETQKKCSSNYTGHCRITPREFLSISTSARTMRSFCPSFSIQQKQGPYFLKTCEHWKPSTRGVYRPLTPPPQASSSSSSTTDGRATLSMSRLALFGHIASARKKISLHNEFLTPSWPVIILTWKCFKKVHERDGSTASGSITSLPTPLVTDQCWLSKITNYSSDFAC